MAALFDTYKVYIIAFLICALGVVGFTAYITVSHLQGQLDEANGRIVKLNTANAMLTTANQQMATDIATQNQAIDDLKKAEAQRSSSAEQALAAVIEERNKWRDRYAVLFGTEPVSTDTCANMTSLVNRYYAIRVEEAQK